MTRNAMKGPYVTLADIRAFKDFCESLELETREGHSLNVDFEVKFDGHWMGLYWNRNTKRYTVDKRLAAFVKSFVEQKKNETK
jgi:hypothetical protein